jgi:DNA-directed RNA polymerase specialized sigma24 family protein
MAYNLDRDTDTSFLDGQDGLQDAIIKVLESNPIVDSPLAFLKTATKNATIDIGRKFKCMKVEFFGDDIDTMEVALPDGQVIDLKNALQATLDGQEYDIFTAYSQGYTLAEIAAMQGIKHDMQVKRILYRASRKVENLGISYWTEFKVECYQGKAGRPNSYYAPAAGISGEVVNRQFLCLDQSKPARQVMPDNYQGDMCPTSKLAAVEIASDTDSQSYNVRLQDMTYSDSTLPAYSYNPTEPYANNREAMQLYSNRKQYAKMIRDNSTVVYESRYNISFAAGRYISTDHLYKNLP